MTNTSTPLAVETRAAATAGLYDRVAAVLRDRYYDKTFRENKLPHLVKEYRPNSSADVKTQREAAEKLLAHVPASHLGLLSEESQRYLIDELMGRPRPTFGFQLVRLEDKYFSFFVLEGGPAASAGILPWERVISIDGEPIEKSRRLDWPQKDAFLSVDRDPPIHSVLCNDSDEISLVLERVPGESRSVRLKETEYSSLEAAHASARVFEISGRTLGYVHFWFVHSVGVPELLREFFAGQFAKADGLILDLRGRGGNGFTVDDILKVLQSWGRPIVALTDRQSRSAKDVLAYEFKQRHLATVVGERTAGAVIPASFAPVGDNAVLMFPAFTLGEYTQKLELKGGVEPDIFVERAGPFAAGRDPILERGQEELLRMVSSKQPQTAQRSASIVAATSQSPRDPSATPLPPVDELLAKMVNALGGEKALHAHGHRTLRGINELVGLPMKGKFLQKTSAPDKSLVEMHLGDLVVRQGFDGVTAWSDTPMTGIQVLDGSAADAVKQQARFYGPVDLRASCREIAPTAHVNFDGKDCIELKLVGLSGGTSYLYVDAASFFAAGLKATLETPVGNVETKTYLRNYKNFDGFVAASETYAESSVQRLLIRIESVSFEQIPPQAYSPPAPAR
jgi:C-terminal processing protease CtpA/Prc